MWIKTNLAKLTDEQKATPEYKQVIDRLTKKGWLPDKWDLDDFVVYLNEKGEFRKVSDTEFVDYDLDY